jgi:methyltransferase family protein
MSTTTERTPQLDAAAPVTSLGELTWSLAREADVAPSIAHAVVETLAARVRQAVEWRKPAGVRGLGCVEPTVVGVADDGVIAALVPADPAAEADGTLALLRAADLAPSAATRVLGALATVVRERLADGGGRLELEDVGVVELAPRGPANRDIAALLVRSGTPAASYRCPVCETDADHFLPFRAAPTRIRRTGARCATCGSHERHRMIWRFFEERTNLFEAPIKRMLHVAPEAELSHRFEAHPMIDYLSVDLQMPRAMVHMDITQMTFESASFDVVYCSHVLEHIPDDRKAIAELYRVLKPGGWAILQVPIVREATEEDPSVDSPEERLRRFDQPDHVRAYGPDYRERLEAAGFEVTVSDFAAQLDPRCNVDPTEPVFYCAKPQQSAGPALPARPVRKRGRRAVGASA